MLSGDHCSSLHCLCLISFPKGWVKITCFVSFVPLSKKILIFQLKTSQEYWKVPFLNLNTFPSYSKSTVTLECSVLLQLALPVIFNIKFLSSNKKFLYIGVSWAFFRQPLNTIRGYAFFDQCLFSCTLCSGYYRNYQLQFHKERW